MARLTKPPSDRDDEEESNMLGTALTRQRPGRASANPGSLSPSPAASFSSDKENRESSPNAVRQSNSKSKVMPPPRFPTPASAEPTPPHTNKRRRLGERDAPNASQAAYQRQLDLEGDIQYYDPDQPMEERRAVRKGIRDLARELTDSRTEFLAPGSSGLVDTLNKANEIFHGVKQTSDATLDSRLLVSTADLSARRATQLRLGDSAPGIDVDEFVMRCISFMRKGPGDNDAALSSSSTQRHRRRRDDSDDDNVVLEGSGDEGDAENWEWLGRKACFPNNLRPPVPGFLLGPLSVQKKVRRQTQRRERLQKRDPRDAVRPEELKAKDLEKVENSNLTTLCKNILELLSRKQVEGESKVEREATEDMSDDQLRALMAKYCITDDGGLSFFHFVINPRSFGQTVENLFYISFLIRDGNVGIGKDSNMLPTLHVSQPRSSKEIKDQAIQKHQAIFHLDFPTWEDLIEVFEIKECMIPNRRSVDGTQVSATGWYG
ncbi:nuclear protein [Lignoscripta atroalba]|nr:nuclear protein [Lignoscripta atroalba]